MADSNAKKNAVKFLAHDFHLPKNGRPQTGHVVFLLHSLVFLLCANAYSFEITSGDYKFSLHGNVNVHYIYTQCDDDYVAGSIEGTGPFLACAAEEDVNAVNSGYLPTSFEFALETTQNGYDISVHTAYEAGLDFNTAFNGGADGEGLRLYTTIGNKNMGTVLLGRTWGLFGLDATLKDMSLASVGAPSGFNGAQTAFNSQLGAAGYGYIFTDRITQITYQLPSSEAWGLQLGLFQPLDFFGSSAGSLDTGSETPGFHGRLRFNFAKGFVSASFLTQSLNNEALGVDDTDLAYYFAGEVIFGGLSFFATYYDSEGIGHTGLFIDAIDAAGNTRDSDGYLVQAMYSFGKTRVGINYGVTNLSQAAADTDALQDENEKITVGVYHSLTASFQIVAEVSQFSITSFAGTELENSSFNIGVMVGF